MASSSSWVLPLDLLLEIAARSDPVTLVRSAAACKDLRRHIADPAFHRRLRLRHSDRFVPTLLRGFFMQNLPTDGFEDPRFFDPARPPTEPSPEPFRSFLSEFHSLFHFYRPDLAASRGLVALRADSEHVGLCVFNPMTGYLQEMVPPPGINAQSFALVAGGHGIYRLLAAELAPGCQLKTQAFSQAAGKWEWEAVVMVAPCHVLPAQEDEHAAALLHPPLVLQAGHVHWLCRSSERSFILRFSALEVQAAVSVSVTKVDGSCGEQLLGRGPGEVLLVSGGGHGRQPRILVAAGLQISLWTLSEDSDSDSDSSGSGWSMQVLVQPERIRRPADAWSERLELRWFGERSGLVFVRMAGADERSPSWYFALDLTTRRVRGVGTGAHQGMFLFPYEMDISFWRPRFPRQLQGHINSYCRL